MFESIEMRFNWLRLLRFAFTEGLSVNRVAHFLLFILLTEKNLINPIRSGGFSRRNIYCSGCARVAVMPWRCILFRSAASSSHRSLSLYIGHRSYSNWSDLTLIRFFLLYSQFFPWNSLQIRVVLEALSNRCFQIFHIVQILCSVWCILRNTYGRYKNFHKTCDNQ